MVLIEKPDEIERTSLGGLKGRALVRLMLGLFVESGQIRLQEARDALADERGDRMQQACDSLCRMAERIGATEIYLLATGAAADADSGEFESADRMLDAMDAAFTRLELGLSSGEWAY